MNSKTDAQKKQTIQIELQFLSFLLAVVPFVFAPSHSIQNIWTCAAHITQMKKIQMVLSLCHAHKITSINSNCWLLCAAPQRHGGVVTALFSRTSLAFLGQSWSFYFLPTNQSRYLRLAVSKSAVCVVFLRQWR